MLMTCLFMMALVTLEAPWIDRRINLQHFVNEAVFYLFCCGLVCFSGVITSVE